MLNNLLIAEVIDCDCTHFSKGTKVAQYILETGYTGPLDFEGCYVSAQFFTTLFSYLKKAEGLSRIENLELLNLHKEMIQCMENTKYYCSVNNDI
jgi:hypothetical protein